MKKAVIVSVLFVSAIFGCAKDNSSSPPPAANLSSVESEAALSGVNISYNGKTEYHSDSGDGHGGGEFRYLTIGVGSVGNTDGELQGAIQVLRKYYALIATSNDVLSEYDRKQRLDTIDSTLTFLQSKRTDLSNKKCTPSQN